MITARFLKEEDYFLIEDAIARDPHHQGTDTDFFYEGGTVCCVYEDEQGPVLFLKGSILTDDIMRLDIQFMDNMDFRRNRKVMLSSFDSFAESCKKNGWKSLCFFSASPLLIKFCVKHFGFEENDGVLIKQL